MLIRKHAVMSRGPINSHPRSPIDLSVDAELRGQRNLPRIQGVGTCRDTRGRDWPEGRLDGLATPTPSRRYFSDPTLTRSVLQRPSFFANDPSNASNNRTSYLAFRTSKGRDTRCQDSRVSSRDDL